MNIIDLAILKILISIRDDGPALRSDGICENLADAARLNGLDVSAVESRVRMLFATWPQYSGCKDYPVSTNKAIPAWVEFNDTDDYWDKANDYGRARYALLDHLILHLSST